MTALGTVKYNQNMNHKKNAAELPIFSDFFICDSWDEARHVVNHTDLNEKAYQWALIWDHNSQRLRLLGYVCPGCSE